MSKNIHATQDWVKDNFSIKNTASGELISLSDSAEAPLQSMKIYGKTKQFTTTGKNKLPYPYYNVGFTKNGITFTDNGDGSMSVSGTAEADTNFFLATSAGGIHFEAGKTYCVFAGTKTVKCIMTYKDENGSSKNIGYAMLTSVLWAENYTFLNYYISVPSGATVNDRIYPIIVEGSSYDGVWEPYTGGIPSPNPNYPQELVSVGDSGSATEYIIGSNLFDISADTRFTKQEDGSYISNSPITTTKIPLVLPFGTYTYSYDLSCNTGINGRLSIGLKDGSRVELYGASDGSFKHTKNTFTGEVVDWCFVCSKIAGAGEMIIKNLQLGVGSTEKPYEPYKEQFLTIPTPNGLPGIPVLSGGNYIDSNGKKYACDYKDYERNVYVQKSGEYRNTGEPMSMYSAKANDNGIMYWNQYLGVTNLAPGNYRSISNSFRCSIISGDYRNVPYGCIFNVSEVNGVRYAYLYFSILTSDTEYGTTYTKEKEAISAWIAKTFSEDTPLIVRYPLGDPLETPLTEEEIQAYKALHTNYPNTTFYNNDGAVAEVEYVADIKNYIDNKFTELQAAVISLGGNI